MKGGRNGKRRFGEQWDGGWRIWKCFDGMVDKVEKWKELTGIREGVETWSSYGGINQRSAAQDGLLMLDRGKEIRSDTEALRGVDDK